MKTLKRLYRWIRDTYLPAWAKEKLMDENNRLREKVAKQSAEIDRLNAYIDGIEDGFRLQKRIVIKMGGDGA